MTEKNFAPTRSPDRTPRRTARIEILDVVRGRASSAPPGWQAALEDAVGALLGAGFEVQVAEHVVDLDDGEPATECCQRCGELRLPGDLLTVPDVGPLCVDPCVGAIVRAWAAHEDRRGEERDEPC